MKVALIHDHLAQDGGAERVLKVLAEMFPEAPIYTLLYEKKHANKYYRHREIETSIIQKLPGGISHYQWYMPFMPMAVEFFDLSHYDLVISDSSSFAKGVITSTHTLHICYCHTPTRYLWSDTHQYINELKYNKYFKKIISLVLNYIRMWDRQAADRVDAYIANSRFVAGRIKKYYRRDSVIIHPPIDTRQFEIAPHVGKYFLTGGRLVVYKRFDLAVSAFNRLGVPLKIFGEGPEEKKLKGLAKPNIEFLGKVKTEQLAELYGQAIAFIHPQIEDFGITAVESMACGRPVIAYAAGGACETVVENKTGKFFDEQTWEALADAIVRFKPENFSPAEIKNYARQFGAERFKREISLLIETECQKVKRAQIKCGF